jgi:serine/threonine protein kinase
VHTVVVKPGDEVAGRYRLEELQGGGGMSHVWRAHDDTLDRTVALKMLSPTADLERFRREARAVASLGHENVMRVFDYGEDDAGPYIALEWLSGGTLEDRLTGGALPDAETERVAAGIAAGLAHLHERGLVHRDLKTANVLFDDEGRPKLGDFGLARETAGAGTLTEAGTVLGTAAYISPEQAAGEPATPASDVYSFGVILFRMLTGALPFVADDALALLDMHRRKPPPLVAEVRPDAPPLLAALTAQALEKDPAARPADGSALLAALGGGTTPTVATSETTATRVLPAAVPPGGLLRRRRAVVATALLLLAATGGLLAWAVTRPDTAAPAGISTHTGPFGTRRNGTTTGASIPTISTTQATSTPTTTAPHTTSATTTRTTPTTTATIPATTATTPTTTATTPTTTAGTTTAPATTASTAPTTSTGSTAPASTS